MKEKISIAGCGWFGTPLAKKLTKEGFKIKGSTTTPSKLQALEDLGIQAYLLDVSNTEEIHNNDFFNCDILILNIPPKTNTSENNSFAMKVGKIAKMACTSNVKHVIFVSSTSVYGDHNENVDEFSLPRPDSQSGEIMLNAENILKQQKGFITTILRFGGLIGPGRNPGRFLSGKKDIPNGKAPVNLVHLADCVGIVNEIIKKQGFGFAYNICAPDHPERQIFYTKAAAAAGLPEPAFNDELCEWKIVSSLQTAKLLNYSFQFPKWEDWINPINL